MVTNEAGNVAPPSTCLLEGTCVLFMLHFKLCMKCICIFVHESMLCISIPIYASKLQSKGCEINAVFGKTHEYIVLPQSANLRLGTQNRHAIYTNTNKHTCTESALVCSRFQWKCVCVCVCVCMCVLMHYRCLTGLLYVIIRFRHALNECALNAVCMWLCSSVIIKDCLHARGKENQIVFNVHFIWYT